MKSSTPCPPSHPAWQPTALVAMHALAAVLLLSYVWPVTAVYWQATDARTFSMLHGSLNRAGPGNIFGLGQHPLSRSAGRTVHPGLPDLSDRGFRASNCMPPSFVVAHDAGGAGAVGCSIWWPTGGWGGASPGLVLSPGGAALRTVSWCTAEGCLVR